jgi:hypothetical protein
MQGEGEAWVWSQYQGVLDGETESAAPLRLFVTSETTASSKRVSWGLALALALGLGLFFPKIAFLLFIIATMMVASGMAPEWFEAFCKGIPGGNLVSRLLAVVDTLLP